jgi:hypothetical protein
MSAPTHLYLSLKRPMLAIAAGALVFLSSSHECRAGIDHEWTYDDSGPWKRSYQQILEYGLIGGEVIGGLWEGGETRFGHTLWTSIDSSAAAGIVAQVMKVTFSRVRPLDSNNNPDLWFKGHGNESLEYGPEHPSVYALELLPVYDAIGRLKLQAHWQTDVIAGFALGTGMGWVMHNRTQSPIILSVMPHAIYVGIGSRW